MEEPKAHAFSIFFGIMWAFAANDVTTKAHAKARFSIFILHNSNVNVQACSSIRICVVVFTVCGLSNSSKGQLTMAERNSRKRSIPARLIEGKLK